TCFLISSRTTPRATTCRRKRRPHSKRYSTASTHCSDNGGRRKGCARAGAKCRARCSAKLCSKARRRHSAGGSGCLLQATGGANHGNAATDGLGVHPRTGSLKISSVQGYGRLEESVLRGTRGWDRLRRSFESRDPCVEARRNPG